MKLLVPILFLVCSTVVCSAQTNTWIAKSSTGFTARREAASVSLNGKIYVLGGAYYDARYHHTALKTLEVYDPVTNTWSRPVTTGTFTARENLAATVYDGKIYAIGGSYTDTNNFVHELKTVEVFDPATNSWSTPNIAVPCAPRLNACASAIDGRIYLVGGETSRSLNETVEVLDPVSNTWSILPTTGFAGGRRVSTTTYLRGKFYITGGWIASNPANSVEVFDVATAKWSHIETTGSFPPYSALTLDTLEGKVFAIDGWDGGREQKFVSVYDPELRLWNTLSTSNTGIYPGSGTSETLGGKIYVFGGILDPGRTVSNAVESLEPVVPPLVRGTATLDPARLDFGAHEFLKDSLLHFFVRNRSSQAVRLDSLVLRSTNNVFTVIQDSKTPRLPYTLLPDSVIAFTVAYIAPPTWSRDSARLYYISNLAEDSTNAIVLVGASKPRQVGTLNLDRATIDFGTRTYPDDSTIEIILSNPSSYTTHLDAISPIGANASQFSVTGNSRNAFVPFDLEPGTNVTFRIRYSPPPREELDSADLAIVFDEVPDSLRLIHLRGTSNKPLHIVGEHGIWVTRSSDGFTARHGLTSAVVKGKIYAIGGETEGGIVNTLEIYDSQTDSWSRPATFGDFRAREFAAAVSYHDSIFVFGGYAGNREWLSTIDVYDPATHGWATVPTPGTYQARDGLAATVYGEKIYLLGGFDGDTVLSTFEVFDPATHSIESLHPIGTFQARSGLSAVVLADKIYAIGGTALHGEPVDPVDVYDLSTNSWSPLPTVGSFTPRELFGSAALHNAIYTFGGTPGSDALSIVDVLDPVSGIWTTPITTGTFTARYGLTSAAIGENIYCIGGYDGAGTYLGTSEMYTRTASVAPDVPNAPSILVYPNPTAGQFSIDVSSISVDDRPNASVVICDLLGRIKVSQPLNTHSRVQTLSVTLSPDTYVLRLVGPHLSRSARIVIER